MKQKDMSLQSLTAVLNLIALIGGGALLFTNKTDAAKFDPAPIKAELADTKQAVAVLQANYGSMDKKLDEQGKDLKEIKQLFYEDRGWNKPAVSDKNAPLVKGVNTDGSPKQ